MSTKDNSGKACIHLTQAQKISALKAVGVEPRKGSAPALIRALPKWAKAHKEASAELGVFVAAEMPATMSSGQKAARNKQNSFRLRHQNRLNKLQNSYKPKSIKTLKIRAIKTSEESLQNAVINTIMSCIFERLSFSSQF